MLHLLEIANSFEILLNSGIFEVHYFKPKLTMTSYTKPAIFAHFSNSVFYPTATKQVVDSQSVSGLV